jgi:hypothetical protein
VTVEADYQATVQAALDQITSLVENLKIIEGIDYQIVDMTNQALSRGNIRLEAIDKSTSLEKTLLIKVEPKNISNLTLDSAINLKNRNLIPNLVLEKVQSLFDFKKIQVKGTDFTIYNSEGNNIAGNSKAGQYRVVANANSNVITGEFNFTVLEDDLSSLQQQFVDLFDTSTSALAIELTVSEAINDFANHYLLKGTDFDILDENEQNKDLNTAGTVIVRAKETGYLTGQFSFEIKKYDLSQIVVDENQLMITDPDPHNFSLTVDKMIRDRIDKNIELGKDYEITSFDQ